MKGLAGLIFALAGTVFAVSENIFTVAGADIGAAGFVSMTLAFGLWLVCAVRGAGSRGVSSAVIGINAAFAVLGIAGVFLCHRGGAFLMLSAALFYGFGAVNGGGMEGLLFFGLAKYAFVAAFAYAMRRKYNLSRDEDILALEREAIAPSLDPELAPAIESRAKKLLGLRDPAQRAGKS